ncbi:hypothetical protein Hanom_Chr11g01036151 [Helianthus anomalus]
MSTRCIPEEDREHYALFDGNEWMGLRKAQKRRRFDFRQAEKAVNEAIEAFLCTPVNIIQFKRESSNI